jgi:hypothetical protein
MLCGETVAFCCENRTEHRYTMGQSVPHRKHHLSAAESNRLMLCGETVAVCCENRMEHTDTVRTSLETHRYSLRAECRVADVTESGVTYITKCRTVALLVKELLELIVTLCRSAVRRIPRRCDRSQCSPTSRPCLRSQAFSCTVGTPHGNSADGENAPVRLRRLINMKPRSHHHQWIYCAANLVSAKWDAVCCRFRSIRAASA